MGVRIAHLRIAHQVANPEVGNPEGIQSKRRRMRRPMAMLMPSRAGREKG